MTAKETWTESQYEAAGMKSIHLRLTERAYNQLQEISDCTGEGRASLVIGWILEANQKMRIEK